jgi:hypothetical protein
VDKLTQTLKLELVTLRDAEALRGQAAVDRLANLESTVVIHLATLGKALEEPMTRLIQTASETPRAAAEVISQLRHEISNNIERDNGLLEDRGRIMEELNTLSTTLVEASTGQCAAVETLVNSSASLLQNISAQFTDHVGTEIAKLTTISDHFSGTATEMSSLGEAFNLAVQLFSESNNKLIEK